jgi:hypothetical protein
MNKNLFLIETSERERILEMHINATKKQYLFEQTDPTKDPIFAIFYSKLGDKSKRTWDGTEKGVPKMTDDDKNKILNTVKEKINKQVTAKTNQGKKITFDKELEEVVKITVALKGTSIESGPEEKQEQITDEIPYVATYPNNTKQNPDLQNFYFKDNEVVVPEDRKEKFRIMIEELKNAIPKNEVITEIRIKAGSTTSQVPTQYSGPGDLKPYTTITEGQQNNVKLAEDRCQYIEQTLFTLLKEIFPNEVGKVVTDKRDTKPNNGPVYTEKERTYFFGEFKKLDPAKKGEYDTKYGPFKGSYGSVMIVTKGSNASIVGGGGSQPVIVNNWQVIIDYGGKNVGSKKQKTLFTSKTGGGITVGGSKGGGLTDCAVW